MNKQERKSNKALEEARRYVRDTNVAKVFINPTPQETAPAPSAMLPQSPPKEKPKYNGQKVDGAEVKKQSKAHFFVTMLCNGRRLEVGKRFKSITKAREFIQKYM